MLTAFFEQNQNDNFSQTLLYNQLPEFYVCHHRRKDKFWSHREKGFVLGRLVYVNLSEGERYYLRLLLSNIRGPRSFEDLRSVNGVLCGSFRESAYKHGLLETDNFIEHCLEEVVRYQMPSAFRILFATLLIYYEPKNPRLMWDKYYDSLSEDYAYNFPTQQHKLLQLTLANIGCILESMGKSFNTFDFGNLKLDNDYLCHLKTKEIEEELNILVSSEDIQAVNMLNDEQQYAYEIIYRRVIENARGCFFLDGPGGTEKTFLYATLLANLRIKGIICVAVASYSIAAANLVGGRTANFRFKIPLDIEQNQRSQISKQSFLAKLIRACKLIIWDEAPMAKRQ
ncbi:uncharacterized protein LOC141588185 [Silene latifolia]|uniref:uncharacterized protein LOC141588185 n=1 Tax=Silene latifolia TaxID=37657 RepID=UPI003D77602A